MKEKLQVSPKKKFYSSIVGTIAIVLCCFTPLLVISLGMAGLGFFTPCLDYVLLPTLGMLIILTFISYRRYKKSCTCEIKK